MMASYNLVGVICTQKGERHGNPDQKNKCKILSKVELELSIKKPNQRFIG